MTAAARATLPIAPSSVHLVRAPLRSQVALTGGPAPRSLAVPFVVAAVALVAAVLWMA